MCDALPGPKTLPLAPALNVALSLKGDWFMSALRSDDPLQPDRAQALADALADLEHGRVALRRHAFVRESVDAAEAAFLQRAVAYGRRWQVFEDRRRTAAEAPALAPFDFFLPAFRVRAGGQKLVLEAAPPGVTSRPWKDLIGIDLVQLARVLAKARDDVLDASRAAETDVKFAADAELAAAAATAAALAKRNERAKMKRKAAVEVVSSRRRRD